MPEYQVGDVVNGHRFNGQEWIPIDPDEATATPSSPPPPPSPTTPQPQYIAVRAAPVKVPGTAALVLSILGFCGVTAILGIVLGFTSRSQAKRAGLPTGKSTAAIVIGALWLLPLALGPVIAATTGGNSTSTAPPAASAPAPAVLSDDEVAGGAWIVCKDNVQEQLKAPSTAQFPPWTSEDITVQVTGNVVGLVAWVEAENSLGAPLRTPFACSANYDPASDSYTVLAELDTTDVPQATGADTGQAPQVLAALRKRGFTCTGPQGKFDLYQCRKGTIQDATYGEMPKELVNVSTTPTGLSLDGYAAGTTIKALAKFGAKAYGDSSSGTRSFDNG